MSYVMSRLGAVALLLPLLWTGCSFRSAIERGHDHVATGHYRAAFDDYQRALAMDPDSEEAARHAAQLRPYAIGEIRRQGLQALGRGDYEGAASRAADLSAIDETAGRKLTHRVASHMRAALEGMVLEQRYEAAYPFAVRSRRLFSAMVGQSDAFQRLRSHCFRRAERQAQAGRFDEALASLALVARHEPSWRGEVDRRGRLVRQRWAVDVAVRAAVAEGEGKLGAAAALNGRAYEIAGRDEDAQAMGRLAALLRREGRFIVASSYHGDAPRASDLESAVALAVRDVVGLVGYAEGDEGAHLLLSADVLEPRCTQSSRQSTAAQPYVAGHRDVANPRLAQLEAELRELRSDRAALNQAASRKRSRALGLTAKAERCLGQRLGPAEEGRRRWDTSVSATTARLERARRRLARLERRLATSATDDGARRDLEQPLDRARARVAALEAELDRATRELHRAERRARKVRRACEAARREALGAEGERSAAERAAQAADRRLLGLTAERDGTPPTVSEPILATFRYPVGHVTRLCAATVRVRQQPAWDAEQTTEILGEQRTKDQTHDAHPRHGVTADPLELPRSDAELIAELDQQVAGDLAALLRTSSRDYYRTMAKRALALVETEPDRAADLMLAFLLAAPSQLDDGTLARFQAHLTARYGLRRWQTLQR